MHFAVPCVGSVYHAGPSVVLGDKEYTSGPIFENNIISR